ncbi:MAG: collagenase [Clostridium sp.]
MWNILYWASKEVSSQFFRVLGNDKALEVGNTDDVLTMVIYNSPKEYKMNRYLYDLSTDNGGMYIEGDGSFYTYERTTDESIYSLEELFRHEFTHYLQGRYLVPGLWGTSDFYQGNSSRITWFEEGSAEFFAGATRKDNIKPRKSVVGGLDINPADRFTTKDLFNSSYGSWSFYNYGSAFTDYMYNNRKEMLKSMMTYIEKNDVNGYDNYIKSLQADSSVNDQYQKHLQQLVDSYDSLDVPLVSDDYIKTHEVKGLDVIKNEIVSATGIKNATIIEEKNQFGSTFTVKGTYTGKSSMNLMDDWNLMNFKANDMLNNVDKLKWTGYKTVTNYFTNYKTTTEGQYQFDIVFTGVSNDKLSVFDSEDVNTDGKVDKIDMITASIRYNTTNKNNDYNIYTDVNKDNIIDIFDLVRIAKKIK